MILAVLMRVRDSFADLAEQFQLFPSLQPLLIAVIGDRHTWHVLHHKVMATTLPSRMPRSPEYHGEPVPSMMWPSVMTRSKAGVGAWAESTQARASRSGKMQTKSFFLCVEKVWVPILFLVPPCCHASPTSRKGREKWGIHGRRDGGATEPHHR